MYVHKKTINKKILMDLCFWDLTEGMLKELLPIIKLRVHMTDLIKPLKAENETSTSTQISPTTPTQA